MQLLGAMLRRVWAWYCACSLYIAQACADPGGYHARRAGCPHSAAVIISGRWPEKRWLLMKIVVIKSPKFLSPILRFFFKISKEPAA
ncbi:stage V sporulation protein SpoVM [Anaerotruncus colihominis]|uniref:Stage V sporulation protein SpoVM n=1 Tax=Anaerotruncus colihominis TaxID=169435 RepID=A0A845SYY8_9FIRM|nr:stage V sporulation protein SpoVM [Anaerotruncus colihominis]NDO39713.1 stage V sporulation protein SpoVM [Anaerotruncus colihominis]